MAQQSTAKLDRWGNPLPKKLKLKSGQTVLQHFFDRSQYHQNCRKCGGDVFGQAIWYVKRTDAVVAPRHDECPAEPVPYVEPRREYVAPAPKPQSVYAERRNRQQPIRREIDDPVYIVAGGKVWEVE